MNIEHDAKNAVIRMVGPLGEADDLTLALPMLQHTTTIDLSRVTRITSSGVKQWFRFLRSIDPATPTLRFVGAPVNFVLQINAIRGFLGSGTLVSFAIPFLCPSCGEIEEVVAEVASAIATSEQPRKCPKCARPMDLDVPPDEYFAFLTP